MSTTSEAGQTAEKRYWAFISYSHADTEWGEWLHKKLETFSVPRALVGKQTERGYKVPKRLMPIFRDREELPSSATLKDNIQEALEQSCYLVVICSPRSAASIWVNEEVLTFKAMGRSDRVLCLIVDGEPNATDKPGCGLLECFPPAVRYAVSPDRNLSQEREEPIAADARPGKDGKNDALLKVVAGLLGVRFDELKRRDALRKKRNRTVLAICACALVSAILYGGNQVWNARKKAMEEQETTARVLDFVLYDVLTQSSTRQQLAEGFQPDSNITMLQVLDRASARLNGKFADKPFLERRVRRILGVTYTEIAAFGKALPHKEREVELARRDLPLTSGERMEAELNLANLLNRLGRFEEAETMYEQLFAPERLGYADKKVMWLVIGGSLECYLRQGKNEKAEKFVRASLEVFGQSNFDALPDEATGLVLGLARSLRDQGKLAEAENAFRASVRLAEQRHGPQNDRALLAKEGLAVCLAKANRFTESADLLRDALGVASKTYGDLDERTIGLKSNLATVLSQKGDYDDAEALYKSALSTGSKARAVDGLNGVSDPGNLRQSSVDNLAILYKQKSEEKEKTLGKTHPDTLSSLVERADFLMRAIRGKEDAHTAIEIYEKVLAAETDRYGLFHPETMHTMQRLGNAKRKTGNLYESEKFLRQARDGLFAEYGEDYRSCIIVTLDLAGVLNDAGRHGEAEKILKKNLHSVEHSSKLAPVDLVQSMNGLCEIYVAQKKYQDAANLYQRLYDHTVNCLGPNTVEALAAAKNLSFVLDQSGRPGDSVTALRQHILNDPVSRDRLRPVLAICEFKAGNADEAKRLLAEDIRKFPDRKKQALDDKELAPLRSFIQSL